MDELYKYPLKTYEQYLLHYLTRIYIAKKLSPINNLNRYADLLVDKFAIHSGTLFHVMQGLIESQNSTLHKRQFAYDPFSVNSLIRALLETYVTFNHIFVSPYCDEERKLRMLLWQLDGKLEQKKFKIESTDFDGVQELLAKNEQIIIEFFSAIEQNECYKSLNKIESVKICDSVKRKVNWKFSLIQNIVRPLKIIELVELICCQRAFINTYKYASVHAHSGFVAIEHFENMRGKFVSSEYSDPFIRQAIYLIIFLIKDLCLIDKNAALEFIKLPEDIQENINSCNKAFRNV